MHASLQLQEQPAQSMPDSRVPARMAPRRSEDAPITSLTTPRPQADPSSALQAGGARPDASPHATRHPRPGAPDDCRLPGSPPDDSPPCSTPISHTSMLAGELAGEGVQAKRAMFGRAVWLYRCPIEPVKLLTATGLNP